MEAVRTKRPDAPLDHGWTRPTPAADLHYFPAGAGVSACGSWAKPGKRRGDGVRYQAEAPEAGACQSCRTSALARELVRGERP